MPKLPYHLPQLIQWLTKHIGLVIVLLYLLAVTFKNWPAPGEWLMGWDNFSVTTDLWLNLKRTLFATWREYRGFGVASDSEVVDLFRQLPLFFLQAFVPNYLLEWVYYFGMYWLGTLGAYVLTIALITSLTIPTRTKLWNLSLIGLAGAVFYTTNLYSIEVFYTPIIMYVARFGFLPWLVLFSWQWLTHSHPKHIVRLAITSLLAAPAFLTATVFFVWMLIALSMMFLYGQNRSKIILLVCVLCLNAFWLLPFSWYTTTKSTLIPKSGTFVTINEILLNAPFEKFELDKILTFAGDFGSGIHFTNLEKQSVPQHPWFSQTPLTKLAPWYYFTGLALWLLGGIYLAWKVYKRKSRLGWWIVFLLGGSLWLLTKEYSPLGIAYNLLNNTIPMLQVVLRFGGTKLNPLIILAGVALSGATAVLLQQLIIRWKSAFARSFFLIIVTILLTTLGGWMGGAPLTGNLLSPVLRVKLSTAYQDIATEINQQSAYGRVLHLPTGLYSYWRSHSWGYYGSSFLNFLVEKPLLEKTFSPGNLEHDYFDQAITNLTLDIEQVDAATRQKRAQQLRQLLQRASVQYVLLDSSIQPEITTKQLISWEIHPLAETKLLISEAQKLGILREEKTLPIDSHDPALGTLTLYTLNQSFSAFSSPTTATVLDPALTNTFIEPLLTTNETYLQTDQLPFRSYPWWQSNYRFVAGKTQFALENTTNQTAATLTVPAPSQDSNVLQAFDIFITQSQTSISVYVRHSEPLHQEFSLSASAQPIYTASVPRDIATHNWINPANFLNNWHSISTSQIATYRLAIANQVIPLPQTNSSESQFVGTILLAQRDLPAISISLLLPETTGPAILDPSLFTLTDNPNCRLDAANQYQGKLTLLQDSLLANTSHGSLCFGTTINLQELKKTAPIKVDTRNYFELAFTTSSDTAPTAPDSTTLFPVSLQQVIAEHAQQQSPLPQAYVCMNTTPDTPCLNHQPYFTSSAKPTQRIVSTDRLFNESQLGIFFHVLTNQTTHRLRLEKLQLLRFAPTQTQLVNFLDRLPTTTQTYTLTDGQLQLPYPQSPAALYPSTNTGLRLQNPTGCITDPHQSRPTARYSISAVASDMLVYSDNCNVTLDSNLPYYGNNPYYWTTTYQVITGNQPRLLAHAPNQISNQLFSQHDDNYPTIPGSKPLGTTTSLANNQIIAAQLAGILRNPTYATTAALINPIGTVTEPTSAQFAIGLTGTNQTLVRLTVPTVFALPPEWSQSYIEPANSTQQFDQLAITAIHRHLPSLWSVELNLDTPPQKQALLVFDQGFDSGWLILNSHFRLLPSHHLHVDGWKNGWLIQPETKLTPHLYVFYAPELLALCGWFITITTLLSIIHLTIRHKLQLSDNQQPHRLKQLTAKILTVLAPLKRNKIN